jgi:hypothetical protein
MLLGMPQQLVLTEVANAALIGVGIAVGELPYLIVPNVFLFFRT